MLSHSASSEAKAEFDGGEARPSEPAAFAVTGKAGRQRYTVSIPADAKFPLRASQYQEICTQAEALSKSLSSKSKLSKIKGWRRKGAYDSQDAAYLEVHEAQSLGLLPEQPSASNVTTCESSMTFAMDTEDASFGKSLLLLWMSYGLAKREGRAFFIDDSRWPYGKYTSYFAPPPQQECVAPPPSQIVPCPHSAKHIVVSAATAQWTFGSSFAAEYAAARKHGLEKSHRIFDLIRQGYEDLSHIVGDDAAWVVDRVKELRKNGAATGQAVVGMQIRRGDLHPYEFEFSRDYLPLEQFTSAAHSLMHSLSPARTPGTPATKESRLQSLLLASDDPSLVDNHELSVAASPLTISPAQDRLLLATKAALDSTSPAEPIREPGSAYVKHVDENAGWDGGFYSSMFNNIGGSMTRGGNNGEDDIVSEEAMRVRELIGKGYLLDLAVLGQSDGVVCAVSSAACRILGVMMGWEAVEKGHWVNVDDGRAWSWDGRRW